EWKPAVTPVSVTGAVQAAYAAPSVLHSVVKGAAAAKVNVADRWLVTAPTVASRPSALSAANGTVAVWTRPDGAVPSFAREYDSARLVPLCSTWPAAAEHGFTAASSVQLGSGIEVGALHGPCGLLAIRMSTRSVCDSRQPSVHGVVTIANVPS